MDGMRKQPYNYALSLGGDGKDKPPLPVAEFISTAHSLKHVQS